MSELLSALKSAIDFLREIAIELIAAGAGFSFGWASRWASQRRRLRRAKAFWQPFVSRKLRIVVGRFAQFSQFEFSGFVGVGDAMALAELRSHLESLGLTDFDVSYADALPGEALRDNLVLLGGPDANTVTREIAARLKTTLGFGDPKVNEIALHDRASETVFVPSRTPDSQQLLKDYALLIRSHNPLEPESQVLIVAGSFGFGTWAGIRFATSQTFLSNDLVASGRDVECLIETDVLRQTPHNINLLVIRGLAEQH